MAFTKTFRKPVGVTPLYPVTRTVTKWGKEKYVLEGKTLRMFKKLFPIHSNRRIAEWFGLSHTSIERFKRELKLKKNMEAIRREQAEDIKRTCEANGYYASLRGKAPSKAAIEGARRLRASGFVPILALKERNPERYREVMRQRSETRKKMYAKECMRVKYGLERKTRLLISELTDSRRAAVQKCSMIAQNNYFADPDHPSWVCYDSGTRRPTLRTAYCGGRGTERGATE